MKNQKPFWLALLAVAGVAATSSPKVQAAGFANGDIIFAVRDVGTGANANADVYLFDLGTKLPGSSGVLATGLGADLTSVFGSTWDTNANLQWSIFGYTTAKAGLNTNFTTVASEAESPLGTQAAGFTGLTQGMLNIAGTNMKSVDSEGATGSDASGFTAGGFTTLGGAVVLTNDLNGYASTQPSSGGATNSFSEFSPSTEAVGFSGSALDMFTDTPAANTFSGTFTVDSSGDVSFSSPVVGVPEPGRAALLGLGLMGLVLRRRRAVVA